MPPKKKSSFLETDPKITQVQFYSNLVNSTGPWFGWSFASFLGLFGLKWGGKKLKDSIRRRYSCTKVATAPSDTQGPVTGAADSPGQQPLADVPCRDHVEQVAAVLREETASYVNPAFVFATDSAAAEEMTDVSPVSEVSPLPEVSPVSDVLPVPEVPPVTEALSVNAGPSSMRAGPSKQPGRITRVPAAKITDKSSYQRKPRVKNALSSKTRAPVSIQGSDDKQSEQFMEIKERMNAMQQQYDSLKQDFNSLKESSKHSDNFSHL